MYVPDEKMRINKYKPVAIPRPVEYMKRFGRSIAPSNLYTGDETAQFPSNKVDMLADADAYDQMMQKVELDNYNKSEKP